jgi:hypothetical protein
MRRPPFRSSAASSSKPPIGRPSTSSCGTAAAGERLELAAAGGVAAEVDLFEGDPGALE